MTKYALWSVSNGHNYYKENRDELNCTVHSPTINNAVALWVFVVNYSLIQYIITSRTRYSAQRTINKILLKLKNKDIQ